MIREFIESLLIASVIAFFLIVFVVQSFVVSGQSMYPTLQNGERLMVNKFIYDFQPPERGDIVIFEPKGDPDRKYIKRVIGLPGDKLVIDNGVLYINGKRVREDYIKEKMVGDDGPYFVPDKHVFVMGDNRLHSTDSRVERAVGYVPYDDIVGQAFWVYWPVFRMRVIDDISYSKLPTAVPN